MYVNRIGQINSHWIQLVVQDVYIVQQSQKCRMKLVVLYFYLLLEKIGFSPILLIHC